MEKATLKVWENGREERITLNEGETAPAAGTTRSVWTGPGTFRRVTWADGAREDHEETALLVQL